jgi:hypothetical protein
MKEKLGSTPDRNDMLDSFIEKGLTREEAEAESLLQMYLVLLFTAYQPENALTN